MATVAIANTDAQLLSATLLQTGLAATVTALYTFDRDPSAPFAVTSGSAVVTNLDADKLDGAEGSAYAKLADNETVTGNYTFSGDVTVGQAIVATGVISPSSLSTSQNDWAPAGLATASTILVTSSAAVNITGIAAQADGFRLRIWNANGDGGDNITLTDQDALSSAVNRCDGPGGSDLALNPGDGVEIQYDGNATRWRMLTT